MRLGLLGRPALVNHGDDLAHRQGGLDTFPPNRVAHMHTTLKGCRSMGGMKWQNDADCAVALAVRAGIIGLAVVDPIVAMGVYLRQANEAVIEEVFAGSSHGLSADAVVARRKVGVWENESRHDAMLSSISVLPSKPVEVSNSLEAFGGARESIEHLGPNEFRY